VNQHGNVEVDQETGGHFLKAHVGQQLCRVDWKDPVESFDLYDEHVFDQEIDAIAPRNHVSFVFEWHAELALKGDAPKLELPTEAGMVAGFQEPRTEMPVHLDRRADDFVADPVGAMLDQRHIPSGYRNIAFAPAAPSFF
jgi:hypothetical protein